MILHYVQVIILPLFLAEPLAADATDYEVLANALNALPSLEGQTVSVTDQETDINRTYTVTFPAALGIVSLCCPATCLSFLCLFTILSFCTILLPSYHGGCLKQEMLCYVLNLISRMYV